MLKNQHMLNFQHTSLLQYVRFALRGWLRTPSFAAVAVITLGLGIGATTALFSVLNAVLWRSFGYTGIDRLTEISGVDRQGQPTGVSAADFQALQQRAHSLQSLGAARFQQFTLVGSNEPEELYGQLVSADCFSTLGAVPLLGRAFSASDFTSGAPPVVVLSNKLWRRSFGGDSAVIGRHVSLNGVDTLVIGIMPPDFQFPHPAFQLWAPAPIRPSEIAARRIRLYSLVARLKPGVSQAASQTELQSLSAALAAEFPESNAGWRAVAAPINEKLLGQLRPALLTLLGAAGFVLLIACLNVANLLMARGISRNRELAIRAALGASRLRLAFQLMMESFVLAAAGGLLGLAVARAGLRFLVYLLPVRAVPIFPRMDEANLEPRALLFALGITLCAAIIFGLAPALEFSHPAIEPALQEGGRGHTGGRRRRRRLGLLIGLEAALSVILLAGAGLMLRSFLRVVTVQPGFRAERVLTAQIPSPWKPGAANSPAELNRKVQYLTSVIERARQIPGVTAAALTTNLPLASVQVQTIIRLEGRPAPRAGEEFRVGYSSISPEYFRVMGIPLLRGRALNAADSAGRPLAAIIDEAMARRFWPNQDALGKPLSFNPAAGANGPWMTVVGIAGNVRRYALTVEPDAQVYVPYEQSLFAPQTSALVLRTPLDPAAVAGALRKMVYRIDPTQPVSEIKTLSQIVSDSVAQKRLYTILLGIFAVVAVALAAAGIFSVISWMISQSRQEIGIRMALGAAPRNVLGAMMARALIETLVGACAGVLGAAALTGLLKSQLYEVTALDPAVFAAAPLALATAAASAAYLSARRALGVDPMTALR